MQVWRTDKYITTGRTRNGQTWAVIFLRMIYKYSVRKEYANSPDPENIWMTSTYIRIRHLDQSK